MWKSWHCENQSACYVASKNLWKLVYSNGMCWCLCALLVVHINNNTNPVLKELGHCVNCKYKIKAIITQATYLLEPKDISCWNWNYFIIWDIYSQQHVSKKLEHINKRQEKLNKNTNKKEGTSELMRLIANEVNFFQIKRAFFPRCDFSNPAGRYLHHVWLCYA